MEYTFTGASAESAHHLHVFVEPWGRDAKGRLQKGKSAMCREALSVLSGLPQHRMRPNDMQQLGRLWQSRCEEVLGLPYGFAPGSRPVGQGSVSAATS